MDSMISSALDEICAQGQSGLALASLWTKLNIQSDNFQKSLLYSNLLKITSLQFHIPQNATAMFHPNNTLIQRFEDAEKLQLKIVASSSLIDNFVGLYDRSSSADGRRVLERLAIARSNGVTQSQLAKELSIKGNNFHYTVKNLECKELIVRQPAIVRTNAPGSGGEQKNSSHVKTNLIHLQRYAKHLDSQQIFEINNGGLVLESLENENAIEEDVHIKDYLPAMKAICDKLEGANAKVLVALDIKCELGYGRSSSGKKAWKSICQRLKDAGIIDEFKAEVNGKTENCVRLMKKFSSKSFEVNSIGCSNKEELKFGRRSQKPKQLVELPIGHQIYDMVDAETSGILVFEVCDRLGIDLKRTYDRLRNMIHRFGMPLQQENYKKTEAFRVWTSRNFYSKSSNASQSKSKIVDSETEISYLDIGIPDDVSHGPDQMLFEHDHSTYEGDFADHREENDVEIGTETSPGSANDKNNHMLPCPTKQKLLHKTNGMVALREFDPSSATMEKNISPSERRHNALPKPLENPLPSLTPNGLKREQRILERLQVDKFILRGELARWLSKLEGKCTTIDSKCIRRILVRLECQGLCKLLEITVPAVTNFGHNRIATVVLHPSVQSLTSDLVGEIHDRLRSFEMQIRGHGSSSKKKNKSIPILEGVKRTQSHIDFNGKAVGIEVLRANGFEPGKMFRAKLLHSFLWGYLSSSPAWDDFLSSQKHATDLKDSHSSCHLFSIEVAIMNIPIELFLQVVGSTQKSDYITDRCDRGLCLSDISIEEYRCLMDTRATERLSLIIDILRRLKLIRLVCYGDSDDDMKISHANLKYAMELRPYIEEPPSVSVTSNFTSLGLYQRIRHDFFLSNGETVDEYWKTLENVYAAGDRRAALHAFPGSAVPEVLDTYYDKYHNLNRFQGASDANENVCQLLKNKSSLSHKRKKSFEKVSVKRTRIDVVTGQLHRQSDATLPDTPKKIVEEHDLGNDHLETVEDTRPNEDEEKGHSSFSQLALSKMKSSHQKRFSWTDDADRQLVIQYVRYRAARGANFHSVNWASLPNLPACPKTCKRRMSSLRSSERFNNAVLKLCNMLSDEFVKHLEKTQKMPLNKNGCGVHSLSREGHCADISNGVENTEDAGLGFEEKRWDDFDDKNIKKALEDVLRLKQMDKLEASKRVGPESEDGLTNLEESGFASPTNCGDQNLGTGEHKDTARRMTSRLIHKKFFKRLNKGISVNRQVLESMAVSNAIELLKLAFLSNSTSELSNLLAETLQRFSKHDLFAAFSYLREKKFMIGGNGKPFVLSQQFFLSLSKSPFPINTGNRAAEFSSWLSQREEDLREKGTTLNVDLQCGDFIHLFYLVSAGELSLAPWLPDEGVGEAEDLRWLKRKIEDNESCKSNKAKKLKSLTEGELVSRREKGFPGIMVSLYRATILVTDTVDLFKDRETCTGEADGNCSTFSSDYTKENLNLGSVVPVAGSSSESPWDAMAAYSEYLLRPEPKRVPSFSPQVFKIVYSAIQKAGDQGLSIKDISQVVDMPGENIPECIIDVLQTFGRALQVNAYGSVRVVDALYRSKYFLTSTGFHQDLNTPLLTKFLGGNYNSHLVRLENHDIAGANSMGEIKMNVNQFHTVTIPEDVAESLNEACASDVHEVYMQGDVELKGDKEGENCKPCYAQLCMPILPWVNGDGTVNSIVYDGLRRRVLGLVMQNPGILEDKIIRQVDVLNPQSCKKLLELMVLDKHLIVRKMYQTSCSGPPLILKTLLRSNFRNSNVSGYCEHFYANPMSSYLL